MPGTLPNSCGQERIKSAATSGYFSGRFNTKVLSADGCQTHPPVIHMTTIIFAISTLQSINVHNGIVRCHTKLKWHTHNTRKFWTGIILYMKIVWKREVFKRDDDITRHYRDRCTLERCITCNYCILRQIPTGEWRTPGGPLRFTTRPALICTLRDIQPMMYHTFEHRPKSRNDQELNETKKDARITRRRE